MFELSFNNVKKYMDDTLIFKNITFQVYAGEKVGVVGANGSGKSTILKLIAGIEPLNCYPGSRSLGYDDGWISKPKEATIAYVEQIPCYHKGAKVIDILKLAFLEVYSIEKKMREMEEKMKTIEDTALEKILKQYSELVQQYEAKGGYDTDEKLSKICTGLKFDNSFLNKDFDLLSGGEKTTVLLGKILIDDPDILLLDEPTNHLDMESIEWLETYLKGYRGIVIVVSHDRYFLDNVVSKIIEIEDMKCETYQGNYSSFVKQKEENMLIQFHNCREQQKEIDAMEKTIKDLREWALRADNNKFFRRAASIQKKLDKMKEIDKPIFEKRNMKLDLKYTQRSGNETIKAVKVSKSFKDKVIFEHADLSVVFGERVALIGTNGSGKTTFLKMLLGEEQPDSGTVELGSNTKVAYLPQRITFKNEELTVLECFREDICILEGKAREYLSKFMFFSSSVFKKVKHLSGGERIRLKLSKLLYEDVNLLILDEPTNHLDIDSIETFEEALSDFKGTILFVSHDRYLISKIAQRVVAIENNNFKSYAGNYDYYKSVKEEFCVKLQKEQEIKIKSVKKPKIVTENKTKKTEQAQIEAKVESLENEIKEIDGAMEAAQSNYEELNRLYLKKEELHSELEKVMKVWLNIE